MNKTIKIGTRKSPLALWQATLVENKLSALGYPTQIIAITSDGDQNLTQPLYELGITGIFTKTLDIAMLNGTIDIAVHSLKDVPTTLPEGIIQGAVLKRENPYDILVYKNMPKWDKNITIATGSLRRKAQWLHRYPHHLVVGLRGNVNTRLKSLEDSDDWQGAIFAMAGLERINLLPKQYEELSWMTPAPAQGALMVAVMQDNLYTKQAVTKLNHFNSQITTTVEREFLKTLEGGCTAPIGALAAINEDKISLNGILCSLDGTIKLSIEEETFLSEYEGFGSHCAQLILKKGGEDVLKAIKQTQQNR